MFTKTKTKSELEETISLIHKEMRVTNPDSGEYSTMVDNLVKLSSIKDPKSANRVTTDVAVAAATNLIGIAMIIHHERANVIASKALAFVMKLR